MNFNKLTLFVILANMLCSNLIAQDGVLDAKFGNGGITRTSFGTNSEAIALVKQSDGKLIAIGRSYSGSTGAFSLARYDSLGKLDSSFNEDGRSTFQIENSCNAYCGAIQADDRVLVGGSSFDGTHSKLALARYLSSGKIDSTFGKNGVFNLPLDASALAMEIDNNSRILIAGVQYASTKAGFYIARLKDTGLLDSSFGTNGQVMLDFQNQAYLNSIKVLNNGKILVGGKIELDDLGDFALAQLNDDGILDSSFGTHGITSTNLRLNNGSSEDRILSLAILPDGKIIAGGSSANDIVHQDFAIARYSSNGMLDSSFGDNGYTTTNIQTNRPSWCYSTILQADGKIVLAGFVNFIDGTGNQKKKIAMVRYTVYGKPDAYFGIDGKVISELGSGDATGLKAILQSDNRIIVGGSYSESGSKDLMLAAYAIKQNTSLFDICCSEMNVELSPNPVQNSALLSYSMEGEDYLLIKLLDSHGRLIKTYPMEMKNPGNHKQLLEFPKEMQEGLYFLLVSTGKGSAQIKLLKI